jgi:Flp pilus assembly protein TadD
MGDVARARGHQAEATKLFEQTLTMSPGHALALNNLAMLRLQVQQPGALDLAQRAAKAAPFEPAVLDTLAQALGAENRLSEAVSMQSRAVQMAPEVPELRLVLARLLLQSGEKAKAKTELQKLRDLGQQLKEQDEIDRLLKSLSRV